MELETNSKESATAAAGDQVRSNAPLASSGAGGRLDDRGHGRTGGGVTDQANDSQERHDATEARVGRADGERDASPDDEADQDHGLAIEPDAGTVGDAAPPRGDAGKRAKVSDDTSVDGDDTAVGDELGDDGQTAGDDQPGDESARPSSNRDDGDDGDDAAGALVVVGRTRYKIPDAKAEERSHEDAASRTARPVKMPWEPGQLGRFRLAVLAIMLASGFPFFVHRDRLVTVVSGSEAADVNGRIIELTPLHLKVILPDIIDFVKETFFGSLSMDVPGPLARALLLGPWPFPVLRGVVDVPTMLPSGRILDVPGYDSDSGLFYAPDPTLAMPPIPAAATLADAMVAVARFRDLLVDALFAAPCDLAGAVAALITPVVRSAIDGCVPGFVFDAPVARIGKSELVQFASLLATGKQAKVQPPRGDAETEKRITGHVMAGDKLVAFDNGTTQLGGPAIESALTSRWWTGRELGSNRMRSGPMELVFYFTGNHLTFRSDMLGRVVIIRLATELEAPGERDLHRPDAQAWLLRHRGHLIAGANTICRAYIEAGSPDMGLRPMRGFDQWSRVVRSALVWVGLSDPLEETAQARAGADPETEALQIVLEALEDLFADTAHFTASAVHEKLKRANGLPDRHDAAGRLDDALKVVLGVKPLALNMLELGHALEKLTKRTVGGRHMKYLGKGNAGVKYRVVRVTAA